MSTEEENVPDFNDILKQIKEQEELAIEATRDPNARVYPNITDDNVNEYILDRGSRLIEDSLSAINSLNGRIAQASDPDEISALSQLIKAATGALSTLTAISLQNKKTKAAKEITETKKKELPRHINNTLVIGTREEIIKQILDGSSSVTSVSNPPYEEQE